MIRALLLSAGVLAAAGWTGAARATESLETPETGAEIELSYRFALEADAVLITLETLAGADGGTVLSVNDQWGGVDAGGRDIADLTAHGADGEPLRVERQTAYRWSVESAPGSALTIRYRIRANEHQAESDPGRSRRPIFNEGLFHAVGYLVLVRPDHLSEDDRLAVTLSWHGFEEAGWMVASSFGAGSAARRAETTLRRLLGALYLAGGGGLRAFERPVRGGTLRVTIAGSDWQFSDDEFVALAESIVDAELALFDDPGKPYYWISLIPVGPITPHGSSLGGTGLTNCFALMLHPNASLAFPPRGMSVAELLAHEMFHEWNGRQIERERPEELVYWFSEGFTDFYARRILARTARLDAAGFAKSVNETIADYLLSPVRGEPNERVLADFWSDEEIKKLPYLRGDIVAMLVDRAMRVRSGGESDLDDLMLELLTEARRDGQRISTDLLLAKFAEHAGDDLAARVADLLAGGEVEIPADLFAPCLEMRLEPAHAFDVGFDLDTSMKERTVVGVRSGSSAAKAGLRDGQTLAGWSVHGGDPDREARFTIEDEGGRREVVYLPRGEASLVPHFAVAAASDAACFRRP